MTTFLFISYAVTLAIVNSWDTKLAASVQVFFTGAKLIALVIIVIGGLVWLGKGNPCSTYLLHIIAILYSRYVAITCKY